MKKKLAKENKWLVGGEKLIASREKLTDVMEAYIERFGQLQDISRDDYPHKFETELELNQYEIDLYSRCLREGKPARAYVTPVSAAIERKEGVIYK